MIVKVFQLLFSAAALLVTQSALADGAKSVFLEELTWTELKSQIDAGRTTILVPIGGTEQSGPYMALGKHNVRARLLSEKIAKTLGNALVAPVIAYVPEGSITPPTAHMRFPGTITVSDDVFEKMLESAARSFKLHGFHDVFFLGDHGGYQTDLKIVADNLNREWSKTTVRAHALPEYYSATQNEYVQQLKGHGFSSDQIGTHAGLADTALTLALAPDMVRADQLKSATKPTVEQGVHGDPRRASAELGQAGVDVIVHKSVDAIQMAVSRP
jgi:creatinine amidohydrolase